MKKNTFIAMLVGLFAISLILIPAHAQAKNIKVGVIDCYSGPRHFLEKMPSMDLNWPWKK